MKPAIPNHKVTQIELSPAPLALLLGALVLLLPQVLRGGIPIEQAQCEFQARHHFIYGGLAGWPPCQCGTPAPPYTPDNFYGDLDKNPVLACQLVQDLAGKFYGSAIYSAFLNSPGGDIEGNPPAHRLITS